MSTNPFKIPIGTSDPVDICSGLPLYPGLGTARAGATGASRSNKLIDESATILITRLTVGAYYSWGVGICGPAIGFLASDVDVLRENIGGKGQLTLTFNEGLVMEAGLFVGASIGFGLNLSLQVYLPQPWYKVWSLAWRDAFAVDLVFNLDILALLIELIQYLLSKSSNTAFAADSRNRLRDTLPDLKRTFGMVDKAGSRSSIEPDLSATPKLTLPFNLANYFAPFKAVNDRLSKVGGEISVGPSLHLQFPVKFNFKGFTVIGGLDGATSADYGNVNYSGPRVSAVGNTRFNTGVKPTRITSHVAYQTSFVLGISFHFKVALAKFFCFDTNSPSLDLTYLLTRTKESDRAEEVPGSVSTCVEGGFVLVPSMILTFTGSNGNSSTFPTGEAVKGTLFLPRHQSLTTAIVDIVIEPPVAGFPAQVPIPANSQTGSFSFTFKNECLETGNRNDPSEMAPPSALTPLKTYTVSATLQTGSTDPCSDYEVEMPLKIEERFLRCQRESTGFTTPGAAPPWDPLAGGTINANPKLTGGESKTNVLPLSLWFPSKQPVTGVPVTVTLLDESRRPHAGSDVVFHANEGFLPLKPSATGTVTLATGREKSPVYGLIWRSQGPYTGYSNRFFLVVDAGCEYGKTEFWIDIWNWS